ncbi:fatty acid desaturase [Azospirillum agricola]|nr:fatty acid desaturase [Azospirillum agricola]
MTHGAAAVAVAGWVTQVCGIPLWAYALLCVYPGFALALVRSFAEHRAAENSDHRAAIVERSPLFGLLFPHNNLHVVHHLRPDLPWYAIPASYRAHRPALVARNGGLVYRGYTEVARRFLFTPHHQPPHPFTH